ncbi:MAG: superoxide dismutase [Bdellovibrionales bacterium]|nr:superoxide dismutase [Bdellovibrionales bacterium]
MNFHLPKLPYDQAALAPAISSETVEFHYWHHHKKYVDELNRLLEGHSLDGRSLEEIVKLSKGELFNNAAQAWNHTFYWNCMTSKGRALQKGAFRTAIERRFGSVDDLLRELTDKSKSHFASGWSWLVKSSTGELRVLTTHDADNPITQNLMPLLACDLWEHAHYIDYRNERPEYLKAFWKLVDWNFVAVNYERAEVPNMTALMMGEMLRAQSRDTQLRSH